MGGCSKDVSYLDRRFSKKVRDNVHGNIYLDPLTLKFVDTEQFQRLRDLKQLGLTYMVYPGAVHSRFEHSLGVFSLAGEAVHRIKAQQGSELGIDNLDIQTVKLAGLLHDVGHGPFSHMFEREFLRQIPHGIKWCHEDMSVRMIDHIVDFHHIDIDAECLKKAKELVIASTEHVSHKSVNEKHFLYDIVANDRNGIDVDKFDYIVRDSRACGLGCSFQIERLMDSMRVMGDEICYRDKDYLTIFKLFSSRADLHRTVYSHAKVKAIEMMFVDSLIKADDYLQISSKIQDPAEFWKIDDSILKTIEISQDQELKEARDLIMRIRRRDLYQFCNEFSVPKDKLEHFKDITPQDIVCSQENGDITLKEEDVIVCNVKIDLTRAFFPYYQDFESNEKFPIHDYRISHLLPAFCEDRIVRVYSKNPDLVKTVSEAFENFQLKTWNESTGTCNS
uniref:Deoxynucleoside triphosphate triphosphohydrolase SAMHD1-like isoform X1 n=1 Tax=Populus alba TaxID=43335 RepID=A0A4U5Q5Z4_POPAL|nr:deoxynucleoside triphosphate triphosphohydrolase SAMHD1-like isoform X1 [Populus alba]